MPKAKYRWVLLLVIAASLCAANAGVAGNAGSQPELRTLTGHVVRGNQSEPVQKAIVYLKNTKSLAIKTYITEPDGSYRFPALSSTVDYEVYAESHGARSDTKTISAFDNRKQVNITLKLRGN